MGLALISNMGAVTKKFSQRLVWRRYTNLVINDDTGFIDLDDSPGAGAAFHGTVIQKDGQMLNQGEAGTRVKWEIDVYTDTYFGMEPDNAYTLISWIPQRAVPPSEEYVHWFRVMNTRRWDNGNLWIYDCTWLRSGEDAHSTPLIRISDGTSSI